MTSRSIRGADGTWSWDRQSLIKAGFEPTGITVTESEVTHGRQQDVCRQLDAAPEGVECLRIAPDRWEYFFNSKKAHGYVERPLLGF